MTKSSVLLTRLVTTIIAGIPILLCTWLGGHFFLVMMVTLTMLSVNEYYYMAGERNRDDVYGIVANILAVTIVSSAFFWETAIWWEQWPVMLFTLGLIIFWLLELKQARMAGLNQQFTLALRAVIYIGFTYGFLILMREWSEPYGQLMLLFLVFAVWFNDAAAYLFGIKFGRHKLYSAVSPKKSWEGSLAGLVITIVWCWFILPMIFPDMLILHRLIIAVIISVFGQLGDLLESLLKREMAVKDSGSLLPGHGGILDRMDSFILTAPVIYYYLTTFKFI